MRSVPLRVSCPSPVRGLASSGGRGRGPVPFPPYLVLGRVPPRGRACASGAVQRRRVGGGGAGCVLPSLGGVAGGPQGAEGRSTSLRPSASPGRASAHANCTLFFTSRVAFVCKKKTRSFRVFPPEN